MQEVVQAGSACGVRPELSRCFGPCFSARRGHTVRLHDVLFRCKADGENEVRKEVMAQDVRRQSFWFLLC